jgi:hypothetical protein
MRRKITKIVALVRDEDRFEAVIVPAAPRHRGRTSSFISGTGARLSLVCSNVVPSISSCSQCGTYKTN